MKLRKTETTKVAIKKNGKATGKYENRPTSYHELSIDDIYIQKVGWNKGDEISAQPTMLNGDKVLILRNVDQQNVTMEFMTMK